MSVQILFGALSKLTCKTNFAESVMYAYITKEMYCHPRTTTALTSLQTEDCICTHCSCHVMLVLLGAHHLIFRGGRGSWGQVIFFFAAAPQMEMFFILVSQVGEVFLLQKLASRHRISGSG